MNLIKTFCATVLAVLCISSSSIAHDQTHLGNIKANTTKTITFLAPEGKAKIEIWSPNNHSKFTCQFVNGEQIVFTAVNTEKCVLAINSKNTFDMDVRVTNLESHDSDYRIWVHDFK